MYRDAIVGAARRLARTGSAIRMSEVAARAGVSRATLYRAFPSRRALLEALRGEGVAVAEPPDVERRAVQAVGRVLLRAGFGGLTMESVAAEGELSLATVYRRFGDRAGLLHAFMRSSDERESLTAELQRGLPGPEEMERSLVAFTESTLAALGEHRALFLLALSAPEEVRGEIRRIRAERRGTVAALAAFLREGMKSGLLRQDDERTLAALYMGQLLAAALLLPEVGEALPPRRDLAARLVRTFLAGVRA